MTKPKTPKTVAEGRPSRAVPGGPPVGRPSKYRPEMAQLAYDFALLGATDSFIAEKLGIADSTFYEWMETIPEFSESVMRGKDIADAQVAKSLYHRALGYSHKAVKMFQSGGSVLKEEYIEHYPPDTAAATLWLKNRQKHIWRDKVEQEITGKDGGAVQVDVTLTPEQAYLKLIGK